MTKKDIIFYSNFCTYCKEVINEISKTSINDNILYVCVDDENIQLPNFVTAVPTIYLVEKKRIVVDEAIPKWVQEQLSKVENNSGDDIQAYFGSNDSSFGCSFSTSPIILIVFSPVFTFVISCTCFTVASILAE